MTRLLVSTYNKVILWDGQAHTVWDERGQPEFHNFFGITWDDRRIYVAEGGHEGGSLYHVFDRRLKHEGVLPIGLAGGGKRISDPHQIYWWDGKLYIVSAKADEVCVWKRGETLDRISWGKSEEPTQHLNSIWCDGKHFYVVEHRKREMPKRVAVLSPGFHFLYHIEIPNEPFIKRRPQGIHNVYIEDGWLYTCSPKALIAYNPGTGETGAVTSSTIQQAHYVRGLARTPGRWFLGLSEVKVRSERGRGDSAVLVLNDEFEKVDLYPLEGTGGLNDIRAIDGPDLAHNRKECPCG